MFKDFFYYSKTQRKGLLVLSLCIVCIVILICLGPSRDKDLSLTNDEQWREELALFKKNIQIIENKRQNKYKQYYKKKTRPILRSFDPNTADSSTFITLGLQPWMAHNILKYRSKGGKFQHTDDFKKIYGLKQEKFDELKPFIQIDTTRFKPIEKQYKDTGNIPKSTFPKAIKYPIGTTVELNTADTAELKKIPTIGTYRATKIAHYREQLGGYYSIEQLNEINIEADSLSKWFIVDTLKIKRIPINKRNIQQLMRHPYINFYQAKVIVEHRRRKGNLNSLLPLKLYEEFTSEDFNRLEHYFSFEK